MANAQTMLFVQKGGKKRGNKPWSAVWMSLCKPIREASEGLVWAALATSWSTSNYGIGDGDASTATQLERAGEQKRP